MTTTENSRAAVRVCAIADAECSRNCGAGACKRERGTEHSRSNALTVSAALAAYEKASIAASECDSIEEARVAFVHSILAASPVEQPAAAPIDDCDDVHELAYEMCINKDSSSRTGTFEFASEDLFAFVRNATILMARTAPAPADERAEFEAWAKAKGKDIVMADGYDGKYYYFIGREWEGWQARAASASETGAEGEKPFCHVFTEDELYGMEVALGALKRESPHAHRSIAGLKSAARKIRSILRSPAMAAEAVAKIRVSHLGHHAELESYVARSLQMGVHEVYAAPQPAQAAARDGLTDEQWYDLASRHANADWNSNGYLAAVKALCDDYRALIQGAKQ